MSYEEFVELVRDMRAWQKKYFKTRSQEALKMSRILEKKIDDYLSGLKQPKLDL